MSSIINFLFGIHQVSAATGTETVTETSDQITSMVTFILQQIPLWITAMIVIILTFIIAKLVRASVENKMAEKGFEENHHEIQIVVGRTSNAAVLLVGVTIALKIAGLDLTPLLAAGAFGLGFALQDLITNFIAGIMILSARHYTIGDVVKIGGSTSGKIVEIQARATILKAFDGTKIVVPNADLFNNQVISYTSNPYRRIQLINGVAYGSDLKKVMSIIMDAVKTTQGVIDKPKPAVWLYEWGDYSINFKINVWIETKSGKLKVQNRLMVNITDAMDRAGISIPYPIQTVLLDKDDFPKNKKANLEVGDDADLERLVTEDTSDNKMRVQNVVQRPLIVSDQPAAPVSTPVVTNVVSTEAAPVQPAIVAQTQPVAQTPAVLPDWLKKASEQAQAEISASAQAQAMIDKIQTAPATFTPAPLPTDVIPAATETFSVINQPQVQPGITPVAFQQPIVATEQIISQPTPAPIVQV